MEPQTPSYMAPNLLELPKSLFIDLGEELLPIINLQVEFYPYYTPRDYEKTVKKLLASITHQQDIDYQLAEFSMQIMEEYFSLFNCVSQARLSEVQMLLMLVGRRVYDKIAGLSGYVYGVFPYTYMDMQLNCEVYLRNMAHLNYDIELNHKPFEFSI